MQGSLRRRTFLRDSVLAGASMVTCSIPINRTARGAPAKINVPAVDRVVMREITDNSHDIFLRDGKSPGLTITRTGFPGGAQGKTLESEWGLALHVRRPHCRGQPFSRTQTASSFQRDSTLPVNCRANTVPANDAPRPREQQVKMVACPPQPNLENTRIVLD